VELCGEGTVLLSFGIWGFDGSVVVALAVKEMALPFADGELGRM